MLYEWVTLSCPTTSQVHNSRKKIMPTKYRNCLVLFLVFALIAISNALAGAQECNDCNVRSISLFQSPATVKSYQVVEMQTHTQWQKVEVQVPVTRNFEEITYTREVFDGGLGDFLQGGPIKRLRQRIQERRQQRGRRVRGFSWGCLVNAFAAYSQCAMSRRR